MSDGRIGNLEMMLRRVRWRLRDRGEFGELVEQIDALLGDEDDYATQLLRMQEPYFPWNRKDEK